MEKKAIYSLQEQVIPSITQFQTNGILKVKRLEPWAKLPQRAEDGSVGFDVYLHEPVRSESVTYDGRKGAVVYRTGLAIEPPEGYYFLLCARSSLTKTGWFLANGVGVIDPSYRGELLVALYPPSLSPLPLRGSASPTGVPERVAYCEENHQPLDLPGRYCQLIPQRFDSPFIQVLECDDLSSTQRGSGGFGSTGLR